MPDHRGGKLGKVIREIRERAGLTQTELALRAGLAANHVNRLEAGQKAEPRFETVARLAIALGISLDDLAKACGYDTQAQLPQNAGESALRALQAMKLALRSCVETQDVLRSAIAVVSDVSGAPKPRVSPRKRSKK